MCTAVSVGPALCPQTAQDSGLMPVELHALHFQEAAPVHTRKVSLGDEEEMCLNRCLPGGDEG